MGVQLGREFGIPFAEAAKLAMVEGGWRLRVVSALVAQGLPAAWMSVVVEAARTGDVTEAVAKLVAPLASRDRLEAGTRVLAFDIIWQQAVVARVGDTIDVKIQGWEEKKGLTPSDVLVVASDGAGALLRMAATMGSTALVQALLAEGVSALVADERANTPLHASAATGNVAICRMLLAEGASARHVRNMQQQNPEDVARQSKQPKVVRFFAPALSDGEFTEVACAATERFKAAAQGDVATLRRTVDTGTMTALMVACRLKQLASVEALLPLTRINAQSAQGCTALYLAAEEGDECIVQRLLEHRADTALAASDKSTPLHQACEFGHQLCARAVIEAGANIEARTNSGHTALMRSCANGHLEVSCPTPTQGSPFP